MTTLHAAPLRRRRITVRTVRITKSLIGYGVIAGPIYVITSLVQAATRDGFDPTRHAWSQLALGGPGWIQITNLVLTGLMLIAFAVGVKRALTIGPGRTAIPLLVGIFGAGTTVAGVFRADAGAGFPVGTPEVGTLSGHGLVHLAAGGVGFLCIAAALLVWGGRLSREGSTGLALACRIVGPCFLLAFVGMASRSFGSIGIPAFVATAIAVFGLLSVLAVHQYRLMPACD